jgi:hypothetical protein
MTDTTTTEAPAEPADNGEGLLANVTATPDNRPADQDDGLGDHKAKDPTAEAQAAELANRERPNWLPEKFWDPEKKEARIDQLAKSYAELEKNFKLGKHKAPADGKYDMTPFADKIPADDPLIGKYTDWAKRHGLSQTAYEELVNEVVELAGGVQAEAKINAKAEREALGANADAIINSMVEWARGFVRSGVWSQEDFEEFKVMGGTAQGMKALLKLREYYEGRVPLADTMPRGDLPSRADLELMVKDPRYYTDESFYNKVAEGYKRLQEAGLL